ncbi:hypothetical protein [Siphonobacter sp. SORGH_AS_1065]|uniref:hypothetical protein n=1 Tax=Siphonobacter sp. SORGH_AS_1065 TaxID=3041795 RepID=UPI00278B8229|nr:hypothetical protein [Siphonobacter sp. SORGH_AS_1065]MDQ1086595.1 hypothetical protein [Siphonobacter sp. SORGH_AS_1065]
MKKLLLFFITLPALVWGQGKIYVRTSEGQKPYTYQLYRGDGTLVDTRSSSYKDEEAFNAPGSYGYSWKVTDASGSSVTGGVDAISHELMNKPVRMKAIYYYSSAVEATGVVSDVQQIPGFNTAGVNVHAHDLMGTPEDYNHLRWTTAYDHTIPNQSFTSEQDSKTIDRVIYNAYNTGTSLQNRIQIRLTFSGSLLDYQVAQNYSWAYGSDDLPRQPDGNVADARPSNGYLVKFQSYASPRGLNFFKETFKKLCTRYQKAINDGTIREISFQLNESGESNISGAYHTADGTYSMSYGDYSVQMRQAFMNFCQARFNTIQTMNQKLGTSIPSFTLQAFNSNMLLNNADGGNNTLQSLWQWYQMESHALFEYQVQRYAYEQVNLTRSRLFAYDVGSIFNGDFFRMKSFNFAQRLLKNDRWMLVKSNNSHEFGAGPFVIDQILSAAHLAGATPCWEPSPGYSVFTIPFLTEAAQLAVDNHVGLSAFSAPESVTGYHSVPFWQQVANNVNLSSKTATLKPNDLDGAGNMVVVKIPFLTVALDGKYDHIGDNYVKNKWQEAKNANPDKHINIRIDDADIRALFVNPYPL